jgi:uncharacterized protein YdeI (YjbR/CyaY-like superfamily)
MMSDSRHFSYFGQMNPADKVKDYLSAHPKWTGVLTRLRKIMLETGLEEDFKWNQPVYTHNGKNVAGIATTKNYAGVWFFQGGSLSDPLRVLVNAQEGKTRAMRHWRFYSEAEIHVENLQTYLKEAIKNQQEGKTIKANQHKNLEIPDLLQQAFDQDSSLKTAFDQLNLTNRRDFTEYIETAKMESTKLKRLEKIIPMIKAGTGLTDRYK